MKKISGALLLLFYLVSCSGKSKKDSLGTPVLGTISNDTNRQKTTKVMICKIYSGTTQRVTINDLYSLASVIKNAVLDVILLRKLESVTFTSGKTYQAQSFAILADFPYYFFTSAFITVGGGFGAAILYKYPIENLSKIWLPKIAASGYVKQKILSKEQKRFSGNLMYIFASSHFDLTEVNRQAGVTTIVKELAQFVYPVVFGGDFTVSR